VSNKGGFQEVRETVSLRESAIELAGHRMQGFSCIQAVSLNVGRGMLMRGGFRLKSLNLISRPTSLSDGARRI
jgi:hypothetical protein